MLAKDVDEDTLCNGGFFASILRSQKTKRPRESDEEVVSERYKARKSIVVGGEVGTGLLTASENAFISRYLSSLLDVQECTKLIRDDKEVPEYKREQQYYKTRYSGEICNVFAPFINLSAFVAERLIEFLYSRFPDNDTLYNYFMGLLEAYGRPEPKEKVSRIMLKCAICAASTCNVNLLFKQAFCSASCLGHYCQ
jgi:hypothetical protein